MTVGHPEMSATFRLPRRKHRVDDYGKLQVSHDQLSTWAITAMQCTCVEGIDLLMRDAVGRLSGRLREANA